MLNILRPSSILLLAIFVCGCASIDPGYEMKTAVDRGFRQWTNYWATDKYVNDSASVAEVVETGDGYVVRGHFRYTRRDWLTGGTVGMPPITYSASLSRQPDNALRVLNLCYKDSWSRMADCVDPNAIPDNRRPVPINTTKFLSIVLMIGAAAAVGQALSERPQTCVTTFRDPVPGEPEYRDRNLGRIAVETCK